MIDLEALKSIHVILNDICPGLGKVQYLGGLSVLISFDDEKVTSLVLEAALEVLGRFSKIDVWMGQSFGFERLAWLKITGLPLQLFSREVIDVVGNSYGKIVHRAARSDGDDDLSYDYIRVLVGDGKRIAESVSLAWRDRKFSIWVAEEAGDWIPEFYKVPSASSDRDSHTDNVEDIEVEVDTDGMRVDNEVVGDESVLPPVSDEEIPAARTEAVFFGNSHSY
ncbi:hypothetical protein HanIR_Chr14g0716901 [Helianthus annuus]|nr:hypothetical protein HanIR_Chr14g0716901 [Helianthus annuus]